MRRIGTAVSILFFALAAGGAWLAASGAATVIEDRSRTAIARALDEAGHDWVTLRTDGLQVVLSGTAQSEAERFQALSLAGGVVDAARVIDDMTVVPPDELEPPRFSVELLRNDDGVSLIGLVPRSYDRDTLVARVDRLAETGSVADMLERAEHPVPEGWNAAVEFGLDALEMMARSKISIASDRVAITALAESAEDKRELETRLRRAAPDGLELVLDLSAPRPVISPFTLRFVMDGSGEARFDACAADTEGAKERILRAGIAAGAPGPSRCTIALGAPSTSWGEAAQLSITALAGLGNGTLTMTNADIALNVPASVDQERFERIAAELEADLPDIFSFSATRRAARAEDSGEAYREHEFVAHLAEDGEVELRGRLPDEAFRAVVESYARSRFGMASVYSATRLDDDLPEGWPLRVLAALEALAELHTGRVTVNHDGLDVRGVTGNPDSSDVVSRLLADKLGEDTRFALDIDYEERLDPVASAPTPESCVAQIEEILAERQISFEPGSSEVDAASSATLDDIAEVLRECGELDLEVAGHTDSQGRAEMNMALSEARAGSVIGELMARRVLVAGLQARGYGETRPIADNDTAAGREANRRIEFNLIGEHDPGPRQRDPELEATLEFDVQTPDEDTLRPATRPEQE